MNIHVGYFGIPGGPIPSRITHLVENRRGRRAMCGQVVSSKSEFQWCSSWDNMVPTCEKCKIIYQRLYLERKAANTAYGRKSTPVLP